MSTTSSSQTQPDSNQTIPIISIGIHRLPTINAAFLEQGTPYRVVAFLDFDKTPPTYQYSAHNLAVLLYNLHPRPKAVLTGTAVLCVEGQEGITEEVRGVWEGYVRDVLEKKGDNGRGAYVPLSDFHSEMGPPPPGTMEYAIRKLNDVFRPEVKHD